MTATEVLPLCPDCHGAMERVDGKLAIIDEPPIPVFRATPGQKDRPPLAAITGFLPVTAWTCPKCGLVKLYAPLE